MWVIRATGTTDPVGPVIQVRTIHGLLQNTIYTLSFAPIEEMGQHLENRIITFTMTGARVADAYTA